MQSLTDISQYRRQRRRSGNFRWILVILFFLACAAAGYFFSLSSFFYVDRLEVIGNEAVTEERIMQLSGVSIGQNIFSLNLEKIALTISMDPLVKEVEVERKLPSALEITISERVPIAILATSSAFIQVDDTGMVLRRERSLSDMDLPFISGVDDILPGIVPGSRIKGVQIEQALSIVSSLPPDALKIIVEVDISDMQKIKLYTNTGIELRLGNGEGLEQKYITGLGIVQDLRDKGLASDIEYIDVSSDTPVIYPAYNL